MGCARKIWASLNWRGLSCGSICSTKCRKAASAPRFRYDTSWRCSAGKTPHRARRPVRCHPAASARTRRRFDTAGRRLRACRTRARSGSNPPNPFFPARSGAAGKPAIRQMATNSCAQNSFSRDFLRWMILPSREEFPLSREGFGQADGKEDCAGSQPREQVRGKTAQALGVEVGRQLRCEAPGEPSPPRWPARAKSDGSAGCPTRTTPGRFAPCLLRTRLATGVCARPVALLTKPPARLGSVPEAAGRSPADNGGTLTVAESAASSCWSCRANVRQPAQPARWVSTSSRWAGDKWFSW